jgi:transglutaminase-like putative cysteine protease
MTTVPWRWVVRHETTYRYSSAVRFAPHVLRLTPRADSVRCLARTLHVTPTPVELSEFGDAFGNSCTRVSFGPEHANELVIVSQMQVETLAPPAANPGSILPPLPWPPPLNDPLWLFRQPDGSAEVAALARRIACEAGHAPLAFFEQLSLALYSTIDRQIRVDGAAQTAAETLARGRGACRDLTVLFLAACRCLGVAARFVSGYQGQEASPDGKRHLHAWPEVFIPELGWLGWDPTHGVPAGSGHVALSAAPEQAATMPVEGGFYFNGPTVTSTLSYEIGFDAA